MRKIVVLVLVMVISTCFMGCKSEEEKKPENPPIITSEQYDELKESKWHKMTIKGTAEFFGVEGNFNKKESKEMGEGYKGYEWHGKTGTLNIMFHDSDGDGKYTIYYMSPSSDFS